MRPELSTTLRRQGVSRIQSRSAKCCQVGEYAPSSPDSGRFKVPELSLKPGRGQHRKYAPHEFTE